MIIKFVFATSPLSTWLALRSKSKNLLSDMSE